MSTAVNAAIWLTEQDYNRLKHLYADLVRQSRGMQTGLETMEEILDLARVVAPSEVPQNVVTMNSKVRFADTRTGETGVVTVVYPADMNASSGKISVLSPVGAALIGLQEGEEAELPLPHGETRRIRIESVLYQPEAEGEFAL